MKEHEDEMSVLFLTTCLTIPGLTVYGVTDMDKVIIANLFRT